MRLSRKLLHLGPVVLRGKPLSHLFQHTELRSLTHGSSFHLQSQQCSMFKSFSFHQPIASIPLTSPVQFSSVQPLSCVWLFVILWTAAHQPSLSTTNSQNLTQTHVHRVSDAIQPFHPLSSPSPISDLLFPYYKKLCDDIVPARIIQDDLLISESTGHLCHIKHHS